MINVTKTFLPDQDEYNNYIKGVWESGWLTNHGKLSIQLEKSLCSYLGIENIVLTNNGTVPLQIALRVAGGIGEVITTPFSYIATSAAIVWQNCTPVFVDIHPEYLTINEAEIEQAITDKTTAILATHVFGNPCNVEIIEQIAEKYNLTVIYDAAHCFGVTLNGQSIFKYGDMSTCSFHATKLFHTAEGGAIFCDSPSLFQKLQYSANFGHSGYYEYTGTGINAKMSEIHAAMGLCVLPHIDKLVEERKKIIERYKKSLSLEYLSLLKIREGTEWNYSYFPITFDSETTLLACLEYLNSNDIFPRRYFYPSLNNVEYLSGQEMPVSESIASRILCLPLYSGLTEQQVDFISDKINFVLHKLN